MKSVRQGYRALPASLRNAAEPLLFLGGWRVIMLLAALVLSQFAPDGPPARLDELLVRSSERWDAGWYLAIARDGYSFDRDHASQHANIAFYPLLPLLIKLVHLAIPSWRLAGILVVHLALVGAVIYLVALVRLDYDRATALRAVVALLLYPTAIFLTAIYTESLLLLALLGATYHARRGQWLRAGLWGACAALTKTAGVIALVPLLLEYWRVAPWRGTTIRALPGTLRRSGRSLARPLCAVLLTCSGAVAYFAYLRFRFGTYRIYFDTQIAWYRRGWFQPFLTDGWGFIGAFLQGRDQNVVNYFYPQGSVTVPSTNTFLLLDLLFLAAAFLLGLLITFRLRASYGLLVLAGTVLTAYSGSPQSLNRYTLILFPIPIAFAVVGRRPAVGFVLFVFSGLLSFYHAYLFINGFWAG